MVNSQSLSSLSTQIYTNKICRNISHLGWANQVFCQVKGQEKQKVYFYGENPEYIMLKDVNKCKYLFCTFQHDISHVLIDVDLSGNGDTVPEFLSKNPHKEVPILVDGEVTVFEG